MMWHGLFVTICALLFSTSAIAQTRGMAIDPPSPEARLSPAQQIALQVQRAESSPEPRDREFAMRRLVHLYRQIGDVTRSDEWRDRRNALIIEQEAVILASPLPTPSRLCDPTAATPTCVHGAIPRDEHVYWQYSMLAEASELRSDHTRMIAMREAAIPFMHGTSPLPSHWISLADEARRVGLFQEAIRLCRIVSEAPLYADQRNQGVRCAADASYDSGDWAPWLAFYAPTISAPLARNPNQAVRFCVAATRANNREIAAQACAWAAEAILTRDAEETAWAEATPQRVANMRDPRNRRMEELSSSREIEAWRADKTLFQTIVTACTRAQLTPDASEATACGGVPPRDRWNVVRMGAISRAAQ
jgi:hypothetical protein